MAKEFTYMGKTLNELQSLSLEEFAKVTTSSARRAVKRGLDTHMIQKVTSAHEQAKEGKSPKAIRTHLRHFVILPRMVGLKFQIYKGNTFENLDIQPEMIGHRLGEYVLTRKQVKHGKAGIGSTKSSSAVTAK
ncbi:MAG: 30S ribosomal protein S19 [archaeon]